MQEASVAVNEEVEMMHLPPGFRFHPTDEEIITHYLTKKAMDERFKAIAIGEVDMNKCEPWDLPKRAKMGGKEWFFFCQRDRKYPTGMRTNRATETGYWKATGKDREIYKVKGCLVGMKKTLVFYKGRTPKGEKTNWVMHEYRLEGRFAHYNLPREAKDEWVVCRIFHKNTGIRAELARNDSFIDQILGSPCPTLPPLMEHIPSCTTHQPGSSFAHEQQDLEGATNSSSKSIDPFFSPYFSTSLNNPNFPSQEQLSNFHIPTYPNPFKASYQESNPIQEHQNILNYQDQTCPNSSANQKCYLEQFSSNHSIVSPSQDTDISSVISNKAFDDLEGISVGHNISDLESLWD